VLERNSLQGGLSLSTKEGKEIEHQEEGKRRQGDRGKKIKKKAEKLLTLFGPCH